MKGIRRAIIAPAIALGAIVLLAIAFSANQPARISHAAVDPLQAMGLPQKDIFPDAANAVITITILHSNDFHGHLESDWLGHGGSAYAATVINDIRDAEGEENVVLMDAGDVYLGAAPISQLLLGESAIDIYNMLGYDVAAYGNHEFDKGQALLISRTQQSSFP